MSADSTESAVGVTWVVLLLLGIWMQSHRPYRGGGADRRPHRDGVRRRLAGDALMRVLQYHVEGSDPTPDGYRDHLLYTGRSMWQVLKAVRAALRDGMNVKVHINW
jgi:hypothetical protein